MPMPYTEYEPNESNKMNTIAFIYKLNTVALQQVDDTLQITNSFVSRDVIDAINDKLKEQNFKVDEGSLRPKFIDGQLHLEGFAMEIKAPKTVGFLSNR